MYLECLTLIVIYFKHLFFLIQCIAQTNAVVTTQVEEERNHLEGTTKTNVVFQNNFNALIVKKGFHGKNI